MADFLWLFVTAGGAAILGIGIAYAMLRSRKLTPEEKAAQDQRTRELYHKRGR